MEYYQNNQGYLKTKKTIIKITKKKQLADLQQIQNDQQKLADYNMSINTMIGVCQQDLLTIFKYYNQQ